MEAQWDAWMVERLADYSACVKVDLKDASTAEHSAARSAGCSAALRDARWVALMDSWRAALSAAR